MFALNRKYVLLLAAAWALLASALVQPRAAQAAVAAQIVTPVYASGHFNSGQAVSSSLKIKNTGTTSATYFVRYTVTDKIGKAYNVPVGSGITLAAGATSAAITKTWTVPNPADPSTLTTGPYKAKFSVYTGNPDTTTTAVLRATNEKLDAFEAHNFTDQFSSFDAARWTKSDKGLGFLREQTADEVGCGAIGTATNVLYTTYLNPLNITTDATASQLRTKMPAAPSTNACAKAEGGEIKTGASHLYGTYEARMQVPNAPSSITGFFLYGGDGIAEIDIEIYNERVLDPATGTYKGKVMFTTYSKNADGTPNLNPTHTTNGEPGNEPIVELPFDPTSGLHNYRFDYYPNSLRFYADGVLLKEWTTGLPTTKIQLFLNSWYPRWMSQTPPATDGTLNVDWIRH